MDPRDVGYLIRDRDAKPTAASIRYAALHDSASIGSLATPIHVMDRRAVLSLPLVLGRYTKSGARGRR